MIFFESGQINSPAVPSLCAYMYQYLCSFSDFMGHMKRVHSIVSAYVSAGLLVDAR